MAMLVLVRRGARAAWVEPAISAWTYWLVWAILLMGCLVMRVTQWGMALVLSTLGPRVPVRSMSARS